MSRRVLVFGPAYLDRVLRVDRPLLPPELGAGPLDLSVGGRWSVGHSPDATLNPSLQGDRLPQSELQERPPGGPGCSPTGVAERREVSVGTDVASCGCAAPVGEQPGPPQTEADVRPCPLNLTDSHGVHLAITLPDGWPAGLPSWIELDRPLLKASETVTHTVQGIDWQDDLGGMGAGFAAALGGVLVSALGPESEPTSKRIASMLAEQGIHHHPIRVPDTEADWTLLISSGPFGDKLPVGFRGCHAALSTYPGPATEPVDVLVAASLTNRLVRSAFESVSATVRVFAPTLKNMTDTDPPLSAFADRVDLLCCNRHEWEALADRDAVAQTIPILSITDGPTGGVVRFRDPSGTVREHFEPAFPRDHPPQDTNRAGEAYASTLLTTLLDAGWQGGPVEGEVIARATRRAAAAAGLVIGHKDFRFPTAEEIDDAIRRGRID